MQAQAAVPEPDFGAIEVPSPDAQERILLEELFRLAGMGERAAPRIGRVLEISRWSDATDQPARAALEQIDPTGRLRVPALLELRAADTKGMDYPGIVPDEEFRRLGAIARPHLLDVVAGPSCHLRQNAVRLLAWLHSAAPEVFSVLTAISRDPDDPQREDALCGLYHAVPGTPGLLEEMRRADLLCHCLPCEDDDVMAMVARWPELIPLLGSLLSSSDAGERRYAARTLERGKNLPAELLPMLIDCLKDADPKVRVYAALSLVGPAPETENLAVVLVDAFETGDRELYKKMRLALRDLGPRARPAAPLLAPYVKHRDWIAVREAAMALRWVDAPEIAIPALLTIMEKPGPDGDLPAWHHILDYMMEDAAISLAAYGEDFPGAVQFFIEYLPVGMLVSYRRGHDRRYVRGRDWAAEALGMLGPRAVKAVPALVAALEYDSLCAYRAAEALVKIGAPGIDGLVGALDHPSVEVREIAASELADLCLPWHEAAFRRALSDDSIRVKAYACAALLRISPDSQEIKAEAERLIANEALGEDREWLIGVLRKLREEGD